MSIELLINEFIDSLTIDKNKIKDLLNTDSSIIGYNYDADLLFNMLEKYKLDEIDLYQFDLSSKVLLVIIEKDPVITLKVILTNLIMNKKMVLFINNSFLNINNFLINKYTKQKISYNLKGEIYLDTNISYNKYAKVKENFDQIVYIGKSENSEEIKKDFSNLKFISE